MESTWHQTRSRCPVYRQRIIWHTLDLAQTVNARLLVPNGATVAGQLRRSIWMRFSKHSTTALRA
jgi:hypothetical protein